MSVLTELVAAVGDHAKRTGGFDRYLGHEPLHAPGKGVTGATWFDRFVTASSGSAATSVCVVMTVRVYHPLVKDGPLQDVVDPLLMECVSTLCKSYCDRFRFPTAASPAGLLRCVDIRGGESGVSLEAAAGYVEIDGTLHRIITITLPLVVNDLWPEDAL